MRPQPLIAVRDVEASSQSYQRLLGCQSAHGDLPQTPVDNVIALVEAVHEMGRRQ
jgi:uroporphyrinogen-III decarboxylase